VISVLQLELSQEDVARTGFVQEPEPPIQMACLGFPVQRRLALKIPEWISFDRSEVVSQTLRHLVEPMESVREWVFRSLAV